MNRLAADISAANFFASDNVISTISNTMKHTRPPEYWIHIHSTAAAAGLAAASITYSAVKASGMVAASTVETGVQLGGGLITEGVRTIFGSVPASITASGTRVTAAAIGGGITAATSTGALVAGATAGATAAAVTIIAGYAVDAANTIIRSAIRYFVSDNVIQEQSVGFTVYDISENDIVCYDIVPKSEEQYSKHGFDYRKNTVGTVQMDKNPVEYNNTEKG